MNYDALRLENSLQGIKGSNVNVITATALLGILKKPNNTAVNEKLLSNLQTTRAAPRGDEHGETISHATERN